MSRLQKGMCVALSVLSVAFLFFISSIAALAYVLPIVVFVCACHGGEEKEKTGKGEKVFFALFSLTYLAMIVQVICRFSLSDDTFLNIFLNDPIYYIAPLSLFALLWLFARTKPTKEDGIAAKFFFVLSWISLIAALGYCAFLCGKYMLYPPQGSSAPWILEPILWCVLGVAVAAAFWCVSRLCRRIRRKKSEQAE